MRIIPIETPLCPQCGKPITSSALMGLCPECLISAGFGTLGTASGEAMNPSFEPPTPDELGARFTQLEILELLGHGGMGAVYKARQKRLERIVALKILPPRMDQDASFPTRFEQEAKALAQLHHPNIVTLHEFGEADGLFYFIMEFVDGLNLRQLLNAGRIAPSEALAIVPQICEALQFAHDRGIVHRDIKPENILLNKEGRVKIADFGVAKLVAGASDMGGLQPGETSPKSVILTEAGKVIGTPAYMAPEQTEHPEEVDHRADIYALGVVFYQMLTGELPAKRLEPPSRKVQIDVRLDEIVLRALEKDPDLRFQQASILKTRVETVADPRGATAGAYSDSLIQENMVSLSGGESGAAPLASENRLPRRKLIWGAALLLGATCVIAAAFITQQSGMYRSQAQFLPPAEALPRGKSPSPNPKLDVEVLGVLVDPRGSARWLKQDGTSLDQAPVEIRRIHGYPGTEPRLPQLHELIVVTRTKLLSGLARPSFSMRHTLSPAPPRNSTVDTQRPRKDPNDSSVVSGVIAGYAAMPAAIDIEVMETSGEWEQVAVFDGQRTHVLIPDVHVVCGIPRVNPEHEGWEFAVSHNIDRDAYDLRMIAHGRNGERREVDFHGGVIAGNPAMGSATLRRSDGFKLGDIVEYTLERSPWARGTAHVALTSQGANAAQNR